MGINVKITAGTTDGQTMEQFQKLIEARTKYLQQTARQSVLATCIDILKSIKPQTKVAKPSSVKVEVKRDNNLYPSFTKTTGKPTFCLRITGTKNRYIPTYEVVKRITRKITKSTKVFRFTNTSPNLKIKNRNYLIICETITEARTFAKKIATSSIRKYAGLAKKAISLLMKKTASWLNAVSDENNNQSVQQIANKITAFNETISETDNGGTYTATLTDDLKYAVKAITGGQSAVDISFKKALNKIAGNISRKLKDNNTDFWGKKIIETPFPELKQRK